MRAGSAADSWIFYGDSITEDGMPHEPVSGNGGANFSQLIHSALPDYFPAYEDGGIGGLFSSDGAQHINTWLSTFPGHFVALNFGGNDDQACVEPDVFYAHYVTMVQAVLNHGDVPIVPTITWGRTQDIQQCAPPLNAKIYELYTNYPQIVHGPDMWSYFQAHQNFIGSDGVHPTEAGYVAYRQQWADAMVANVYGG